MTDGDCACLSHHERERGLVDEAMDGTGCGDDNDVSGAQEAVVIVREPLEWRGWRVEGPVPLGGDHRRAESRHADSDLCADAAIAQDTDGE